MVWAHEKAMCMPKEHELPAVRDQREQLRAIKGYVPVIVGTGKEMQRFLVSIEVFKDQRFVGLLELAAQEFGYKQRGILKIPCDVKHFQQVLEDISEAE